MQVWEINISLTCTFTEPPIGLEPMPYALRGRPEPSWPRPIWPLTWADASRYLSLWGVVCSPRVSCAFTAGGIVAGPFHAPLCGRGGGDFHDSPGRSGCRR